MEDEEPRFVSMSDKSLSCKVGHAVYAQDLRLSSLLTPRLKAQQAVQVVFCSIQSLVKMESG